MSQQLAPLARPVVVRTPGVEALKPVQRRAIFALLENPTIADAAEAVEKSERTLYRWMRDPLFQRCLRDAMAERESSLEVLAMHSAGNALEALNDIAANRTNNPHARVQAARALLEHCMPE